jgi:hypothetical protein
MTVWCAGLDDRNKHTRKRVVRQVGYLQGLLAYARLHVYNLSHMYPTHFDPEDGSNKFIRQDGIQH